MRAANEAAQCAVFHSLAACPHYSRHSDRPPDQQPCCRAVGEPIFDKPTSSPSEADRFGRFLDEHLKLQETDDGYERIARECRAGIGALDRRACADPWRPVSLR